MFELPFANLHLHGAEDGLLYTINRDIRYKGNDGKQVDIPCDIIHAQLKLAENSARQAVLLQNPAYGGNIATANIGFVVSSNPYDAVGKTHTRRFITIPLHRAVNWSNPNQKHHFTTQIRELWTGERGAQTVVTPAATKAGGIRNMSRNPSQLKRQQRANSCASLAGINRGSLYHDYPFADRAALAGSTLEQDFHHSEQTIYEMLQKPEVIRYYITNFLAAYNVHLGDKVYAIILDIFTTRCMCQGCVGRAHSTAHHPRRGLLARWEYILRQMGYRVPKMGLRMAIRATSEIAIPRGRYRPQLDIWTLNPGRENINSVVMEADAQYAPLLFAPAQPINDLFRRTVFLSRDIDGNIQDTAIETFRLFLRRFNAGMNHILNPMHEQNQADSPATALIAAATPKITVAIPPLEIEQKRLAQDIYLPSRRPTSLTGAEFRGLYFI